MLPVINIFDRFCIVDNFYTDPDFVRNLALSLPKEETSRGNYAGIMSFDSFLTNEHLEAIGALLNHPVAPSTQFSGNFRFTKSTDSFKQDIHFDPGDSNCFCAGVCYLTPNHPTNADGTIFWKHNKTGLESIPLTSEGIQHYGWNDTNDLKLFLETDGIDHSLWTRTLTIPFKYNRLVLFRPWLFHSPGAAFGNTFEDCRLIQTFFLSPT